MLYTVFATLSINPAVRLEASASTANVVRYNPVNELGKIASCISTLNPLLGEKLKLAVAFFALVGGGPYPTRDMVQATGSEATFSSVPREQPK